MVAVRQKVLLRPYVSSLSNTGLTTFLMSGATFAAAFLIPQEFQFVRGYSPISAGVPVPHARSQTNAETTTDDALAAA